MSRYSLDPSAPAFSHRGSVPPAPSLYCKRQNSGAPPGAAAAAPAPAPCPPEAPRHQG
ncbi:hypothetical protein QTO34_001253 [Cnephaeus nilssonii]|uniref:Uncharacterized protein n=1 Tax=Cnephaeus nilssonii TaxID=3371016 RepID=A0AA40LNG1_CNENI|nr:hypothetical protein QTO34_001253 [Eptesicus nilssonii]